jgi:1-acyl-sn-glycerol-3-phosphate acyltransferase
MTTGRDANLINLMLKIWRPFLRFIFRVQVTGIEKLRVEPYILVCNHNIALKNHFPDNNPEAQQLQESYRVITETIQAGMNHLNDRSF